MTRTTPAALALALALAAPLSLAQPRAGLANPASQNCVAKGGVVSIEKNPKGGEFGVCTFADARQCEEWALMRGQCPEGGIRVAGYATPAARYCAISGGTYTVVSASNTPEERGTCRFPNGKTCGATAFFDGSCTRQTLHTVTAPAAPKSIRAHFACGDGRSIDATFVNGPASRVDLVFSDGRRMSLPLSESASGARYANADEGIVFWNKGNTAFVDENGRRTWDGCATKP